MPLSNHLSCRLQHILDEDPVPTAGLVYKNVGHGANELAVLNDRAAAHECVNIGPTHFYKKRKLRTAASVKHCI